MITTAPEGRLSVKTTVGEANKTLLREACLREIRRGGQVYYLHNEVSTIDKAARELKELVPEADVHVAHGQMPERELERIMLDFYHRRFNILVCSTIIESGIDVPTANTIIVERRQIRVGATAPAAWTCRSLAPSRLRLPADPRLAHHQRGCANDWRRSSQSKSWAPASQLASHDLEIRGAGELLGESQSGAIDEIGFTLYAELLNRAVKSLQAGMTRDTQEPPLRGTEINLHAPALLPENYLPDVHLRLMLYKRIAGCAVLDELRTLREGSSTASACCPRRRNCCSAPRN